MPSAPPSSSVPYAKKIKWLREDTHDYTKYLTSPSSTTDTSTVEKAVQELNVKDKDLSEEEQIEAIRKSFLMPSHPAEENTGGIAKESSNSTASTHQIHDEDHSGITSGGNVSANAHKANPGPVHADNLPTPETKEDLKKRAEELNK
ncbi:hypothetical protein EK21DRAFT_78911 [Setomelanomma holmii]|uniref:Uncharacterized protein n=1 Tax=Setomelanomma holmii TaxID=210430 RepID=A0A9P4GZE1_9PLEO|nr:hypothetical protein EK21DRAFT_78911 [Setomelanomma holmii]